MSSSIHSSWYPSVQNANDTFLAKLWWKFCEKLVRRFCCCGLVPFTNCFAAWYHLQLFHRFPPGRLLLWHYVPYCKVWDQKDPIALVSTELCVSHDRLLLLHLLPKVHWWRCAGIISRRRRFSGQINPSTRFSCFIQLWINVRCDNWRLSGRVCSSLYTLASCTSHAKSHFILVKHEWEEGKLAVREQVRPDDFRASFLHRSRNFNGEAEILFFWPASGKYCRVWIPFWALEYKLPFAKVWSLMRCTISSKGGANSESSRWSASQAYVPNGYESVAYRHPLTCLRMSHAFRDTPSELSGAHLEMSPRFP